MCESCERLAQELADVQAELDDLRAGLDDVETFCRGVASRAEQILSRRRGVPRGTWALMRGRSEIANLILERLG